MHKNAWRKVDQIQIEAILLEADLVGGDPLAKDARRETLGPRAQATAFAALP